MTSEYVSGLIPNLVRDENPYPFRNRNNVIQRRFRLFVPSTIALWNDLLDEIRESDTMLSFKSRITPVVEKMPPYFEIGDRELIILPACLRNFYSNLNYDLFRVNLTADPSCVCGNPCFHFFFKCPIYNMCHLEMGNTIRIISIPIFLHLLLNGSNTLTHKENSHIFLNVQMFISKMFCLILKVCFSLQAPTVKHTHLYIRTRWRGCSFSLFFFFSSFCFSFSFCLLSFHIPFSS